MTYSGTVKHGVVAFDNGQSPADGTRVTVAPAKEPATAAPAQGPVGKRLLKWAGILDHLPKDMALNQDHYLHGLPKR